MNFDFLKYFSEEERSSIQQKIDSGKIDPNSRLVTGPKAANLKGKLVRRPLLGHRTYNPLEMEFRRRLPRETNALITRKLHIIEGIRADHLNSIPPEVLQSSTKNFGKVGMENLRRHLNWLADHD